VNNDDRPYSGTLTIVTDSTIYHSAEKHPEIQKIANDVLDFDKEMSSTGEIFKSHTLGIKQKYEFEDMHILGDGKSNSSWFISQDMISSESDPINSHEITVGFEPKLKSSDFPWWIPKYIDDITLDSLQKTFLITTNE
jgi:hypothetical protein